LTYLVVMAVFTAVVAVEVALAVVLDALVA
jgi:hypothetical protein